MTAKPLPPQNEDPSPVDGTAAEHDWSFNTEFDWNGHHHRAHIFETDNGYYFIQIEDLDVCEVPVATSAKFRMAEPILERVEIAPNGRLVATVVNQKKNRLVAKEIITLERNTFLTPPLEEEPVEC